MCSETTRALNVPLALCQSLPQFPLLQGKGNTPGLGINHKHAWEASSALKKMKFPCQEAQEHPLLTQSTRSPHATSRWQQNLSSTLPQSPHQNHLEMGFKKEKKKDAEAFLSSSVVLFRARWCLWETLEHDTARSSAGTCHLGCWHGLRRAKLMLHTNNPKIPSQSCRTPGAVPSQPKYTAGGEKPPSSCHHSNNPDIPSPVVLPVNHKILQQHFPFFFFYNKKAQTCTLVFLPVTYNEDFLSPTKTKGQDWKGSPEWGETMEVFWTSFSTSGEGAAKLRSDLHCTVAVQQSMIHYWRSQPSSQWTNGCIKIAIT